MPDKRHVVEISYRAGVKDSPACELTIAMHGTEEDRMLAITAEILGGRELDSGFGHAAGSNVGQRDVDFLLPTAQAADKFIKQAKALLGTRVNILQAVPLAESDYEGFNL